MKKLVFLSILLSSNMAFAVSTDAPIVFKAPEGMVCKGDPNSAEGIYCVSENPPVVVAPEPINSPAPPIGNKPDPKMPQIKRRYEANLKKWQARKLQNYTFTLQRSCFCLPEYTTPMTITVNNGKIVSAVAESLMVEIKDDGSETTPKMVDVSDRAMTVDQLFNEIKQAIDNKAASVNVKYDARWGYPRSIYIDLDTRMADEEIALTSTALKPISGNTVIKPLPVTK